jgi:prephenate dehydratase
VILSAEDSLNSTIEKNKASLKLILNHSNGNLAKVLNIFHNYNINLTKIQSIPVIETPWKYSFFIDITFTNINDYTNAIKNVKLNSELLKEFGLYKSEKL